MDDNMGKLFEEKRKALGLKQEEVADRAGLRGGNAAYSIYERGRVPKFDVACRIAYALRISPDELARELGLKVWGEVKAPRGVVPVARTES